MTNLHLTVTHSYLLRGMHRLVREQNLHGHDYRLLVHLNGEVDSKTGVLVPRSLVQSEVERLILKPYDKKNWSEMIPFTSGEYLNFYFNQILSRSLIASHLSGVTLLETRKNFFPSV